MTSRQVLERLCSPEFLFQFAAASTPQAIRDIIRRSDEFRLLREKYESGTIPDTGLKNWVNELLLTFWIGEVFENEIALCAVAVLLESYSTDFAEEYLSSLSKLQAPELSLAMGVANRCLRIRSQITTKHFARHVCVAPVVLTRKAPKSHGFLEVDNPRDRSHRKISYYAGA
jgi:hypothetical protein